MTMSMTGSLTCLPRFSTPRSDRPTLGAQVGQVAQRLGKPLMPWQQLVADVAFEIDPVTGLLWYDEVDVTVPRQSGKTTLISAVTTHRGTVMARRYGERQVMAYTAQTGVAAKVKLEREFAELLRASRSFAEVLNVKSRPQRDTEWMLRMNSGDEHILLGRMKSILACKPPTPKAGHGDVLDLGVIDEAFSREDDAVEQAMQPGMVTRRGSQLWVVSTAGDYNEALNIRSFYLWDKVQAGRERCDSGGHGRTAYFEWSAPEDADPGDPDVWRACSPALGYTITLDALASRWRKAQESPDPEAVNSFKRGYLNIWPRIPTRPDESLDRLTVADWSACSEPSAKPPSQVVVAVDAAPRLASASIAVAGVRSDGRVYVEVVAHRPGVDWVPDAVAAMRLGADVRGVYVAAGSPVVALVDRLSSDDLHKVNSAEFAAACEGFVAGVRARSVAQRTPSKFVQAVNTALAGAVRRPAGDGGFTWSRRSSAVDISPLVAATLAHHLAGVPAVDERPVFAY